MPGSAHRADAVPAPPLPRTLVVVTAMYLLAAAAGAVISRNGEFVVYLAVVVVLIGIVLAVHRRAPLSVACLWALSAWGAAHMAGGLVLVPWTGDVLYNLWLIPPRWLKFDQLVHAFGFGVATWAVWECSRRLWAGRPGRGAAALCALAGMGLGAANEVVEFVATLALPRTNVGGYTNTGWDLVFNTLGAATAATILSRRRTGRPGTEPPLTPG